MGTKGQDVRASARASREQMRADALLALEDLVAAGDREGLKEMHSLIGSVLRLMEEEDSG